MSDPSNEALALIGLGEALSGSGQLEEARDRYDNALAIARQIGAQHTQARAHDCLACVYHFTGDHALARHHWQQALALYSDLGVPDAAKVSAKLLTCHNAEANPRRSSGAYVVADLPGGPTNLSTIHLSK
jgi:tetratricopeptide (TPR) repeat protein